MRKPLPSPSPPRHPSPARLAAFAALALLLAGCPADKPGSGAPAAPTAGAEAHPVARVTRRDIEETVEAPGFVESVRPPFDVRAEIGGRIANILVDTGSYVKAGDKLVELDDTMPTAELEEATRNEQLARLECDRAERDLRRQESLFAEGFSTEKARLDAGTEAAFARIRLQVASTRLGKARVNLSKAVVKAPFDGFIADLSVSPGQIIGANTSLLMRLHDFSKLRVVAKFNEFDAARMAVGREASVAFDSLPGVNAPGSIAYVSPFASLDQNLRVFTAKIDFSPKDAPVRPGVSSTVSIVTRRVESAVCAPLSSVFSRGAEKFVYVRNPDGSFARRTVVTGLNDCSVVEIRQGLAEGESVALTRPPGSK